VPSPAGGLSTGPSGRVDLPRPTSYGRGLDLGAARPRGMNGVSSSYRLGSLPKIADIDEGEIEEGGSMRPAKDHLGTTGMPLSNDASTALEDQATALLETAGAEPEARVRVNARYHLRPTGALECHFSIDASQALGVMQGVGGGAPSLPRVGVKLLVPADLGRGRYFGRGPHENYPDRKLAAHVAEWSLRVGRAGDAPAADLAHTPYLVPGECGGRCDVRWLSLSPELGPTSSYPGLRLDAPPGRPFALASASRFSTAQLAAARHDCELEDEDDGGVEVHLDAAHMGLGGDNSWSPSVLPEFLVPPGLFSLTVTLSATTG